MAFNCPNTRSSEWKRLRSALGTLGAYRVFIDNGDSVPNMETVEKIIRNKKGMYVDKTFNYSNPMASDMDSIAEYIRSFIKDFSDDEVTAISYLHGMGVKEKGFGRFKKGIISLTEGDNGTIDQQVVRHEVFHKVFTQYIPSYVKERVLNAVEELDGFKEYCFDMGVLPETANDTVKEEYLARLFQSRNLGKAKVNDESVLGKVFKAIQKILLDIKVLFGMPNTRVDALLKMIDKGMYGKRKVQNNDVPVTAYLKDIQGYFPTGSMAESIDQYLKARRYLKEKLRVKVSIFGAPGTLPVTMEEAENDVIEDIADEATGMLVDLFGEDGAEEAVTTKDDQLRKAKFREFQQKYPEKDFLFHLSHLDVLTKTKKVNGEEVSQDYEVMQTISEVIADMYPTMDADRIKKQLSELAESVIMNNSEMDEDTLSIANLKDEIEDNKHVDSEIGLTGRLKEFLSFIKVGDDFINPRMAFKVAMDVFYNERLDIDKLHKLIPDRLQDYGKGSSERALMEGIETLAKENIQLGNFDAIRYRNDQFIARTDSGMQYITGTTEEKRAKVIDLLNNDKRVKKEVEKEFPGLSAERIATMIVRQGIASDTLGQLYYVAGSMAQGHPAFALYGRREGSWDGEEKSADQYEFYFAPVGRFNVANTFSGDLRVAIARLDSEGSVEERRAALKKIYTADPTSRKPKEIRDRVVAIFDMLNVRIDEIRYSDKDLLLILNNLNSIHDGISKDITPDKEGGSSSFMDALTNQAGRLIKTGTILAKGNDFAVASNYRDRHGNSRFLYNTSSWLYDAVLGLTKGFSFSDKDNPLAKRNILLSKKISATMGSMEHVEVDSYGDKDDLDRTSDVDAMSNRMWYSTRFLHGWANALISGKEYYQFLVRQSNRSTEDAIKLNALSIEQLKVALSEAQEMEKEYIDHAKKHQVVVLAGRTKTIGKTIEGIIDQAKGEYELYKKTLEYNWEKNNGQVIDKSRSKIKELIGEYKFPKVYEDAADQERFESFAMFYLNNYITGFHVNSIFGPMPSLTKHDEDFIKRMQGTKSPGKKVLTGKGFAPKTFKYAVFDETKRMKSLINDMTGIYKKIHGKSKAYDITDGITFITKEALNHLKDGTRDYKLGNAIKNLVFGIDENGITRYVKTASFVLTDEICDKFPEAKRIRDMMIEAKVTHYIAASAYKVGRPINPLLVKEDASKILKEQTHDMSYDMYRIQGNPVHQDDVVTNPSQFNYFLNTNGLNEAEAFAVYQADKMLANIRWDKFVKRYDILKDGTIDLGKFKKAMMDNLSENDERIHDLLSKGVSLDYPSIVRNAFIHLSSLTSKNTIKVKSNGAKLTVRSAKDSGVFEVNGEIYDNDSIKVLFKDNPTRQADWDKAVDMFYRLPYQVREALMTLKDLYSAKEPGAGAFALSNKDIIATEAGVSENDKPEYDKWANYIFKGIDLGDAIPRRLRFRDEAGFTEVYVPSWWLTRYGMKVGDFVTLDPLYKAGFGVRIPTTGIHSGIAIKIVGVLDRSDNVIIAPEELVAMHGSDFDVDSLFLHYFEISRKKFSLPDAVPAEVWNNLSDKQKSDAAMYTWEKGSVTGFSQSTWKGWMGYPSELFLEYAPADIKSQYLLNMKMYNYISVLTKEENKVDMNTPISFDPIKLDIFEGLDVSTMLIKLGKSDLNELSDEEISAYIEKQMNSNLANLDESIRKDIDMVTPHMISISDFRNGKLSIEPAVIDQILGSKLGVVSAMKAITGQTSIRPSKDIFKLSDQLTAYNDNFGGKDGVGRQANAMKVYAYLMYGSSFTFTTDDGKRIVVDGKENSYDNISAISDNSITINGETFKGKIKRNTVKINSAAPIKYDGQTYNELTTKTKHHGNKTFENGDTLINGYIDNVKEMITWIINATPNSIDTIALMTQAGMEMIDMALILNSPAVKYVTALGKNYDSTRNDLIRMIKDSGKLIDEKAGKEVTRNEVANIVRLFYGQDADTIISSEDITNEQVTTLFNTLRLFDQFHTAASSQIGLSQIIGSLSDFKVEKEQIEGLLDAWNDLSTDPAFDSPLFKTIPQLKNAMGYVENINQWARQFKIFSEKTDKALVGTINTLGINIKKDRDGRKAKKLLRNEFNAYILSSFTEKLDNEGYFDNFEKYVAVNPKSGVLYTQQQADALAGAKWKSNRSFVDRKKNNLLVSVNKYQAFVQDFIQNDIYKLKEKNSAYANNKFIRQFTRIRDRHTGIWNLEFNGMKSMKKDEKLLITKDFLELPIEMREKFVIYSVIVDKGMFGAKGFSNLLPAENTTDPSGKEWYDGIIPIDRHFNEKFQSLLDNDRLGNVMSYFNAQLVRNNPEEFAIADKDLKDIRMTGLESAEMGTMVLKFSAPEKAIEYFTRNGMVYHKSKADPYGQSFAVTYEPVGPVSATNTFMYDSQYETGMFKEMEVNQTMSDDDMNTILENVKAGNERLLVKKYDGRGSKVPLVDIDVPQRISIINADASRPMQVFRTRKINKPSELWGYNVATKKNELVVEGTKYSSQFYKTDYTDTLSAIPVKGDAQLSDIKKGVSELFESNPELSKIGTQSQYSQYLDTIFPDSAIKNIVYHGTDIVFDKFDKSKIGNKTKYPATKYRMPHGFYFTKDYNVAKNDWGKLVISAIINLKNPDYIDNQHFHGILDDTSYYMTIEEYNKLPDESKKFFDKEIIIRKFNSDGVIIEGDAENKKNEEQYLREIINNPEKKAHHFYAKNRLAVLYHDMRFMESQEIVFEPEQIHILGSKQDIEGFKKFISSGRNQLTDISYTDQGKLWLIHKELFMDGTGFMRRQDVAREHIEQKLVKYNIKDRADVRLSNDKYYITYNGSIYRPTTEPKQIVSGAEQKLSEQTIKTVCDELSRRFGIGYKIVSEAEMKNLMGRSWVRGSLMNGVVYINREIALGDTLFHEFAHPFVESIRKSNRPLYDNLIKEIRENRKDIVSTIERRYPIHENFPLESQENEMITQAIGEYAEMAYNERNKTTIGKLIQRILDFISSVIKEIGDRLFFSAEDVPTNATLKEVGYLIGAGRGGVVLTAPIKRYAQLSEDELFTTSLITDNTKDYSESIATGDKFLRGTVLADQLRVNYAPEDIDQEIQRRFDGLRPGGVYQVVDGNKVSETYTYERAKQVIEADKDYARKYGRLVHKYLEVLTKASPEAQNEYDTMKKTFQFPNDTTMKEFEEYVKEFYNSFVKPRVATGDIVLSEKTMFMPLVKFETNTRNGSITVSGVSTTADMIVQHSDGTYSYYDYKTGRMGSESYDRLKFQPKGKAVGFSEALKGKLELVNRCIIHKSKIKDAKFREIALLKMASESGETNEEMDCTASLQELLDIWKAYYEQNNPEMVAKRPELFNALEYYAEDSELRKKRADMAKDKGMFSYQTTQRLKTELLMELAKINAEQVRLRAAKKELPAKDAELSLSRRNEVIKQIAELETGTPGILTHGLDKGLNFFKALFSSVQDQTQPIIQSIGRWLNKSTLSVRDKVTYLFADHDAVLEAVRKQQRSIGYKLGADYRADFSFMWKRYTPGTDSKLEGWWLNTYKSDSWSKLTKEQKAYADYFRWMVRYQLFATMKPAEGIKRISDELSSRSDISEANREMLKQQIEDLKALPAWDKFSSVGYSGFRYFDEWIPRSTKQLEESGSIGEYFKRSIEGSFTMSVDEALWLKKIEGSTHISGLPLNNMGRKNSAGLLQETDYTWNTEIIFKEFTRGMIRKRELDDVYQYAIAVKDFIKEAELKGGTSKHKQTLSYIESLIDGHMLERTKDITGNVGLEVIKYRLNDERFKDDKAANTIFPKGSDTYKRLVAAGAQIVPVKSYVSIDMILRNLKNYYGLSAQALKPVSAIRTGLTQEIVNFERALSGSIAKRFGVNVPMSIGEFSRTQIELNKYFGSRFGFSGKLKDNKLYMMNVLWGNLVEDYTFDKFNKQQLKSATGYFAPKEVGQDALFFMYREFDIRNYSSYMIQQMKAMKVSMPDGSTKDMYSLYETKNGKLVYTGPARGVDQDGNVIMGLTADEIAKMKNISRKMIGNMRPDEQVAAQLNVIGNIYFQFKRFFFPTIEAAWKGKSDTWIMGDLVKSNKGEYQVLDEKHEKYGTRVLFGSEEYKKLAGDNVYMLPVMEWKTGTDEGYMISLGTAFKHVLFAVKSPEQFKEYWSGLSDNQKNNVFFALTKLGGYFAMIMIAAAAFGGDDDKGLYETWSKMQDSKNIYARNAVTLVNDTVFEYLFADPMNIGRTILAVPTVTKTFEIVDALQSFTSSAVTGDRVQSGKFKGWLKGGSTILRNIPFVSSGFEMWNLQYDFDDLSSILDQQSRLR